MLPDVQQSALSVCPLTTPHTPCEGYAHQWVQTVPCELSTVDWKEAEVIDPEIIVVVDVEATCWKDGPPPGEQNEIIEVGVCLFDLTTGEPFQKRSLLVKPARSKVSEYCTKLTTITPEMVDEGMSFAEACAALEADYSTRNRLWGSWGNYDRVMFEAQCASFFVPYPFSPQYVNLKGLFAEVYRRGSKVKPVGMLTALRMAKLTLQGTHHRGADDAWNIALLLRHMINKRGAAILEPYWEGVAADG